MTWADWRDIPGTRWNDPNVKPGQRGLRIALVAVDFPDQPFVITQNKTGEGNTCGYNCFNWVVDANPGDIGLLDFRHPDGTPVLALVVTGQTTSGATTMSAPASRTSLDNLIAATQPTKPFRSVTSQSLPVIRHV